MNKNFLYEYISVGLQQNSIPRDFKILWEVFMTFKKYSSVESSFISEKIIFLQDLKNPPGIKKNMLKIYSFLNKYYFPIEF